MAEVCVMVKLLLLLAVTPAMLKPNGFGVARAVVSSVRLIGPVPVCVSRPLPPVPRSAAT